jgi:hypothetical protein
VKIVREKMPQRLLLPLLLLLAGCYPNGNSSWGKRQKGNNNSQLSQPQPTAAQLDVGAEEKQNETLQEGETAYLQCRIRNLQNRYTKG